MSNTTAYPVVEPGSPLADYERVMFMQILVSMARSLRDENLSLAQVAALHLLGIKQELRVGEVADALNMQLPGASKIIGDLVERGLCLRHEDANDRRAKIVTVSAKGKKLIEGIAARRAREASFAMGELPGEVSDSFNQMFVAMHQAGLTTAPRKRTT